MKILFVCPNAYMSASFTQMIFAPRELAVALVSGLVEQRHEVTFVTAPDIQTPAKVVGGDQMLLSLLAQALKSGSDTRHIDAIRRDYEVDLLLKAVSEARYGKYDVVHIFQKDFAHYFDALFAPTPTLYTLHDPVPEPGTLADILYTKFRNHRYVTISNSQRAAFAGFSVVDTVYHSIDSSKYPFQRDPEKRWVFMGRMVAEKGLGDAIKASVVTNTRLLVASDWSDASLYSQSVEEALDNPMIERIGVVDQKRRAQMLGRGKALLFPIKWEEPFGMVMIEAMACGTPVIAYNRGSVPEVVRDGVTGFIVNEMPHGQCQMANGKELTIQKTGVEGLIEAMKRIGEIDRRACRTHVEERFSITQMVEGYEQVYRRIQNGTQGSSLQQG
jgi:glycosyltransferase involved in cell wall biosynthesis